MPVRAAMRRSLALSPTFGRTLLLLSVSACGGKRAAPDASGQIADYVVGAFEDRHGNLWFGTLGDGAARWDGRALTYFDERDGLEGDAAHRVVEDADGGLWFAGHGGLYRYDGAAFTRVLESETRVRTDRRGSVWASTDDGVYRWDGSGLVPFEVPLPAEPPAGYAIRPGRLTFLLEDSRGHLWFGTDGYGALRYDGESFTRFTKQDGLCSDVVWNLLEDREGDLWFACIQAFQPAQTGDGGVCRYDGASFTSFPDVPGLAGNDIYTLYQQRSGDLWIGATGVGAYRHDGSSFTLFAETDRPDLTASFGLQAMVEDAHGTLWCGFSGGLFRFDGRRFVNVRQDGPWR